MVRAAASAARRRRNRFGGYLLLEALTALGIFGVGILPAAWLAPRVVQWWREHAAAAQALRIAAEAAELAALAGMTIPPLPAALPIVSLRHARGLPPPRWCLSMPRPDAASCPPGPRIVVVGPLPPGPTLPRGDTSTLRRLGAIALWRQP